jgi:hypothetical protein
VICSRIPAAVYENCGVNRLYLHRVHTTPKYAPLIAVLCLLVGCASSRSSWTPIPVMMPNDRIRVGYHHGGSTIGTLGGIISDTLYFAEGVMTPVSAIKSISVSGGKHRNQQEGALLGALAGVGLGVAVGLIFTDSGSDGRGSDVFTEALVFGLGGTMAGFWLGTIVVTEEWIPIPPSQWRPQATQ